VNLLALDTSSVACSVALRIGDDLTERHEEQPREHTRLLMPMIESLLADAGASLSDLDAIVLGNGPGSFIGMRIAASVAQGLAFGASLQIVPVSSMAAIAARVIAVHGAGEVIVAQDAHMQEVYLGIYRPGPGSNPEATIAERLHDLSAIAELEPSSDRSRFGAGYGWQRYPELLVANRDRVSNVVDILHPHATDLLGLATIALENGGGVKPQNIAPAYLRHKVAEKPGRAP
jgi:tRNA threonylcarbamoyladenosine biosynthesis protein TsaB